MPSLSTEFNKISPIPISLILFRKSETLKILSNLLFEFEKISYPFLLLIKSKEKTTAWLPYFPKFFLTNFYFRKKDYL